MSTDDFRRIAIVGVGLIGGSIAFAVRRTFPDATIVGVDTDDVVIAARQLGALTHTSTSLDGIRGADLIVLAAPVLANLRILPSLPDLVGPGTLVTDTGSTKRAIVAEAAAVAPHLAFVGGHPLAGAARGGIEASRVDLFERRPWVLTPSPERHGRSSIAWPGSSGRWARPRSRWIPSRTITCWPTPVIYRS